ncbi:arylamine N-acetyltransferase family protein [Polyangium aurulentum]|uniref:arylamine N-acetyltransferase family protein n=1 Tax=Polyangium aurulentum TaxID=2567896 RepID=UPI0010AE4E31|nr:arylamine N-acetyltransferase [Polyangium aurulentum]UQA58660.1 arylamine N-acetyltransferase [Polyangium aurulentum]
MSQTIDLDAYFQRIGYTGPRAATLDVLRDIVRRHAETIPFENLSPFLGWPVPLDLPSLEKKLLHERRGGYCFEQNRVLQVVLQSLGFRITPLAARVLWNIPEDTITPRSHMLLRVDLDEGPYIADVGFGGQTPTGPLRLETGIEQSTPHEPYRLFDKAGYIVMQAKAGESWRTTYRFDLQEQFQADFEVTNYYLSTHPNSHFRTTLRVARPAPGCRYTLLNRQMSIHHVDGPTERRVLESAAEMRQALERDFLIAVPDTPDLDAAFERLPQ